jgi:arsenate reductase
MGKGRFRAYSAGSHPKGEINSFALDELTELGLSTQGLRSKGWEEFAQPDAPHMDFVFTVCDQAAGEVCPVWPGQPMTAHWGMPDPAAVRGSEQAIRLAFRDTAVTMKRRLELMLALPIDRLDGLALQREVKDIGKSTAATTNVLVLCTHNSARSVLAEGMLNHWARRLGKSVRGHSAGSTPSGRINPLALEALSQVGIDVSGFSSKSWDAFSADDAPPLSIVITVCDDAAAEVCPVFYGGTGGQPVKVHWSYPDPSNAEGGEAGKRKAFELTRQAIGFRMLQLLALPLADLDRTQLQQALIEIGRN